MPITKRPLLAAATALAAAALLAACSSTPTTTTPTNNPPPSSNPGATDPGTPTDPDAMPATMTQIRVAVNPAAQMAPIYYARDSGIFAAHNLEVEIVPNTDVANIVSGIQSGDLDFGFATVVHSINAAAAGLPIIAVGTPDAKQPPSEDDFMGNALVASATSGVENAGQLSGKMLCVIGLSSLNTLAAYDMASKLGVADPFAEIELTQLPFGQMPQALANGDCDAAVIQAPFIQQAVDLGGKIIGKPNVETFGNMAVGLFNTTQAYIDANPAVVNAFVDSILEGQAAAAANIEAAQDTLVGELGITEAEARASTWNTATEGHVNVDGFEKAQDLLVKYVVNDLTPAIEALDVSTLIYPRALG
jgi:NitT/TauT family transport system substrate-binding protein